jgi:hypothetical protein
MEKKVHFKNVLAFLGVAAFFWIGSPANAQTQDNNSPPRTTDSRFNDTTRGELASFDRFLDSHHEIAEQLRKDPSLVKSSQFVQNHPALQTYLQQHPEVREELTENPSAFMRQENRYDRSKDAGDRDLNRPDNDRRDVDTRRETDNRSTTGNPGSTNMTTGTTGSGTRNSSNPGASNSTTAATGTSSAANANSRGTRASQSTSSPSQAAGQPETADQQNRDDDRQGDRERSELARFDQFLDSHREIADQLRKNPSLADNQKYLQDHPALQNYLQDHPAIREQLTQHPDAFMQREDRYDYREDARDRNMNQAERARFDQFLDGHREIADQLRKNPSLANNQQFVQNHPALQSFLQQNPGIHQQLAQNPNTFMQREDRYDTREEARNYDRRDFDERQDNRERGVNREEVTSFDRFLDSHREEAEQLRRNPSLANNKQFVASHPALQAYLQDLQGVREQLAQNPNGFMREQDRYDRREDMDRSHMQQAANFRDFLGGHSRISEDLSRNPMKANDPDYKRDHPELQAYLSAHPDVQSALNQNPQSFMKTVQHPATPATTTNVTIGGTTTGATGTTKTATPPTPKPPMR